MCMCFIDYIFLVQKVTSTARMMNHLKGLDILRNFPLAMSSLIIFGFVNRSISKPDSVSMPFYITEKIPAVTSRTPASTLTFTQWLRAETLPRFDYHLIAVFVWFLSTDKGPGCALAVRSPLIPGRFFDVYAPLKVPARSFLPYWFWLHNAIGLSQGQWLLEFQFVFGWPRLWLGVNQGCIPGSAIISLTLNILQ